MQAFTLNFAQLGTGRVFPPEIESKDWIGYHATSSYHSASIESSGFSLEKPISREHIERVIQIAERFHVPANDVRGFLSLSSTSFSSSSELALSYTKRKSLGGQGLEYVREAAQSVIDGSPIEADNADLEFLKAVLTRIDAIRLCEPVVYAVHLQGLPRVFFQRHTRGVYAYQAIPAERIVAKLIGLAAVDHSKIDQVALMRSIDAVFTSPGNHYLKELQKI